MAALIAGDNILWYENDGGSSPHFRRHYITKSADAAWSVYAADLDGDGDLDVLSASADDDTIAWYENDGKPSPSFKVHQVTDKADRARSVFAIDLDHDGDIDILSASEDDDTIAWYRNDGKKPPGFEPIIVTREAKGAKTVYAADLNGDGHIDILSASSYGGRAVPYRAPLGKLVWYESDGKPIPTFREHPISRTKDKGHMSIWAADLDGDGDLDVLSGLFGDEKIVWYENTGK